ncbi:MAG: Na(+)-translocating NADH-quinone reductase subunit A [Bacteroidales bacterium]|nr:Na(+)-translocating NADH-quinone reductase subunit A [Bacteroidales bacterium]
MKKGLDVPVCGAADLLVNKSIMPSLLSVEPTCFKGFSPRLLVREGDRVLCGSPVICDKQNPGILLCSPASGTVKNISRGEKRKLLAVVIEPDTVQEYVDRKPCNPSGCTAEQIREILLSSGLWLQLVQRPYGIVASPSASPKAIFVSSFSSAPLAADSEFCLGNELAALQAGVNALARIAPVHISSRPESVFAKLENAAHHFFSGPHPAGNVGVQISHISPIRKGEVVWTVSLEGLAAIGRLFLSGRYDLRRKIAVCGPMAVEPSYASVLPGTPVKEFKAWYGTAAEEIRFVSGDLLSGRNVGEDGCIGFYDNQLSLIREGREKEYFGWIRPLRLNQFSTDHSYFNWILPRRKYSMDTNIHGGKRAFLVNDAYYAKMLPMDIYPIYLVKACLAKDIDKMEKFGIYEVLPEDLALCEFADPSKNDIQDIIASGIDLMLKEMA